MTALYDTPLARYRRDLKRPDFNYDAAQEKAIAYLQDLYDELTQLHIKEHRTIWPVRAVGKLLKSLGLSKPKPLKGLYFWGGVGRGKTYLMDNFYECLPLEKKKRTHFHRFMRRIHRELSELKNTADPLDIVATKLAKEAKIICFDEFFVTDITDAMILSNLLDAFFKRGIILIITSNITPDGLYKDGLQRARFLPAIDLLKQHTQVVNVDGGIDYRLRVLEQAELYHHPLNDSAHHCLQSCFMGLVPEGANIHQNIHLDIENRPILAQYEADDVVWFDFADICGGPRSQNDYIELAQEYHAVLVANVPQLGGYNEDQARRFIYLVDEFYDRYVKLIITAEQPIESLYGEGQLAFEFKRTESRVREMQSHDYLAKAHRP